MKTGLQLYSIHDIVNERGIKTALMAAHVCGYDGVEFAGFGGLPADELKNELEKYGLETFGAHMGCNDFEEKYDETVAYLKTIGAPTVCVPWAKFDTAEEWADFGKRLDKIGAKLKEDGIRFGYHNHTQEFEKFDGKYALDIIFENTSPENVFLELDTRHAAVAGVNPSEVAEKYSDRMFVLHAKDTDMTNDVAVGCGVVDFKKVFGAADKIEYTVVENENVGKNLEEIRIGCKYIKENF